MPVAESEVIHNGPSDGWHGKIEEGTMFPVEEGRYHLYVGLFCPFAQRANLVRHLKGLTGIIDVSILKPFPKGDDKGWPGWRFPKDEREYPSATVDHVLGSEFLHEVYFRDDPEYKGRYSVPVLYDKKARRIVNNESAEILRWLPNSFSSMLSADLRELDFYPPDLRSQIDEVNEWVQTDINVGMFMAGFAADQGTYETNVLKIFSGLNRLEKLVFANKGPYILGTRLTELDIRLFCTLIRFDCAFVQHFKLNLGTIRHDYPVLNNWLKNLYWNVPGFRETTDFKHIKESYTKSHLDINPKAITPLGPIPNIEHGVEHDFSKIMPGGVDLSGL